MRRNIIVSQLMQLLCGKYFWRIVNPSISGFNPLHPRSTLIWFRLCLVKRNLKIKTFYGTSKNAVMTQAWVAIILYLLLSFIKFQTRYSYSMLEFLRVIRERLLGFESILELLRVNFERLKSNRLLVKQLAFYYASCQ